MPENKSAKKPALFLIDGSSYIYRAFFALPRLANSKGFPTNAIYGFTNMLLKVLREYNPELIAVAFDAPGPTFRHEAFAEYKANRPVMPEELRAQIPYIKEITKALGIPILEKEGFEADDLIGTLAKKWDQGEVIIISGDKDLLQLISPQVTMYDPMKNKKYQSREVEEYFGVPPERVTDLMGLCGDTSDNIPGIPGIGKKTAAELIRRFGSIEELMNNLEKVENPKVRANLKNYAPQALLSKELATLNLAAPINWEIKDLKKEPPDLPKLQNIFGEMEFAKLLKEFSLNVEIKKKAGDYFLITEEEKLKELAEKLRKAGTFALALQGTVNNAMRAEIVGLSFSCKVGEAFYIPVGHSTPGVIAQLSRSQVLNILRPLLEDEQLKKLGHNLKNDYILLAKAGVELQGIAGDLMIASYLLNPAKHRHTLEELAREYLEENISTIEEVVGSGAKTISFAQVEIEEARNFACTYVDMIMALANLVLEKVKGEGLVDLFEKIELPLVEILAQMEMAGIKVDLAHLQKLGQEFNLELEKISQEIYDLAGEIFNINSPQQLGKILFEKLKLPGGKRTKTGYATDVDVLTQLAQDHLLPAKVLAYRSLAKLKSTYVDALPELVNPLTGRLHTSFHQTVTATGRLSSSDPNLQNIPIRTPEGKRIREAFIPEQGFLFLAADYSQIELRILAHLSGDPLLKATFEEDEDVHAATAAEIFQVAPDLVTAEMRRLAKVINFGIIYGMSAFGLSRELGVSPAVAQAYIDNYFQKYQGVRNYIDQALQLARERGLVTTLLNRRRYIPDIISKNRSVRQLAERMAINAPIQGTAADLIKLAMIKIYQRLKELKKGTRLILQIHDELLFEVPEEELSEVKEIVKKEMEGVIELTVPLKVKISQGRNWAEVN